MNKKVRFKKLSYAAYSLLGSNIDDAVIYFITDKPFIYVGNTQYGITLDESKHLINSVQFTSEGKLVYTISGSSKIHDIPGLGIATETQVGFMGPEQVKSLNKLIAAMGDIDDVKKYIDESVGEGDTQWTEVTA